MLTAISASTYSIEAVAGSPDAPAAIVDNQAGRPGVKSTDFDSSIGGIDRNEDGIRDDIETYIDRTYPDPRQNAAMKQYARIQQRYLIDADDRSKTVTSTRVLYQSFKCLRDTLGNSWVAKSKDLLAMFLNTEPRFAAYGRAMDNSAGELYEAFEGEACIAS
ncbi:hypothetical protein OL229_17100 [Neisseriaceae bacterium JH1-16]|nr:hypothetical protein [Neisseriaceae bacterium JH1-16]